MVNFGIRLEMVKFRVSSEMVTFSKQCVASQSQPDSRQCGRVLPGTGVPGNLACLLYAAGACCLGCIRRAQAEGDQRGPALGWGPSYCEWSQGRVPDLGKDPAEGCPPWEGPESTWRSGFQKDEWGKREERGVI